MTKIMKSLVAGLFIATLGLWVVGSVYADPSTNVGGLSQTIRLSVTIANQKSVHVEDDAGADIETYDFGSLLLGQASVNTSNIDIDNDSGGITESFQLSIGDSVGGLILEATSAALASDRYRVSALFQDTPPTHDGTVLGPSGNFDNNDILTTAAQTASDAAGGIFAHAGTTAAQDGFNDAGAVGGRLGVAGGSDVRLWLRLELSTLSSLGGAQVDFGTVYITVI